MTDLEQIWKTVLGEIEVTVSRPIFFTWFKNTSILGRAEKTLSVQVPNAFVQEWLRNHYEHALLKLLRKYLSDVHELQFVVGKEPKRAPTPAGQPSPKTTLFPQEESSLDVALPFLDSIDSVTNLNPRFTLTSFIVGKSNELVYAAAKAVTETPGSLYNPLFVYGGVGLGKTHLLHAIGNEIALHHRGKSIRYISSETFTNELVYGIRTKTTSEFRERYRTVDVLLIDDIQFIGGKDTSQEELFHTFNDLSAHNKQVVFSSDRPPKNIPIIEDRLRSRFEGGMIADIGYPDFEMRVAILKTKAQERRVVVPDEILAVVAQLIQRNVRELEGALTRLVAEARGPVVDFDEARVRKILNEALNTSRKTSPKHIIKVVAEFYDLDERELIQKSRRQEIVYPRQVAMFLLREELRCSYPAIGARFGGRDHTTVMHACNKIEQGIKNKSQTCEEVDAIRNKLRVA